MASLSHPGLWRGGELYSTASEGIPSGYSELDALLPGHGWPRGMLTEILSDASTGSGLRLVMPALARLSRAGSRIAWVAPPYIPYAPGLVGQGLCLSHILIIRAQAAKELLWAGEQLLRSGTCVAVLMWPDAVEGRVLRRLQLAAEQGRSWGVLFRPPGAAAQASTAALRLQVSPSANGIETRIIKRRGGWPTESLCLETPRCP